MERLSLIFSLLLLCLRVEAGPFLPFSFWQNPPAASAAGVSSNGLVTQLLLDGNALDSSTNGNNGTLASTASPSPILPTLSEGFISVSAAGAQNQYVYVTNVNAFHTTNAFTYSIWFSRADSNHFDPLFIQWDSTSGGRQLAIQIADNSFTNAVMVSIPGITNIVFSQPIIDPHLHLMTLTKTNTTWSLYMDGVLSQSATITNAQELATSNMWIGASFPNGSSYGNLSLMDARVYSRALSATEAKTLWLQGSASLWPYNFASQGIVEYNVTQRNALGLDFWMDGNLGVVTNGGSYAFTAANSTLTALTLGSLDAIASSVASTGIGIATNGASQPANYRSGGHLINIGGNTNVMLVHQERWPGGNSGAFWASLACAVSTNLSSWADCGTVVTPHTAFDNSATSAIEMGGFSCISNAGYLYVYYNLSNGNFNAPTNNQFGVARCAWTNLVASCAATNTPTFFKYNGSVWTNAGLGGADFSLPAESLYGNGLDHFVWEDFAYSQAYNAWVMLLDSDIGVLTQHNLRVLWSTDGLTWFRNAKVASFNGVVYPTLYTGGAYPNTLGTSNYAFVSTSLDPSSARWDTATVDRFLLNLQPPGDPTLVAQYKFNGTTWDNSGDSYDATNVNAVGYANYTTGEDGGQYHAISLDGSSQAVSLPALMLHNHAQSAGTFCAWVKMGSFNGGMVCYELGNGANNFAFQLPSNASDTLHVNIGSNTDMPGVKNNFSLNTWYHLAVTWDGAHVIIYVNGAVDKSYGSASIPNSTPTFYATTQLGRYWIGSSSFGDYLAGAMDDAQFYNAAKTGAQILAINNAGAQ